MGILMAPRVPHHTFDPKYVVHGYMDSFGCFLCKAVNWPSIVAWSGWSRLTLNPKPVELVPMATGSLFGKASMHLLIGNILHDPIYLNHGSHDHIVYL